MKKIIPFLITLLFFSSIFGMISYIPITSASAPPSSLSNNAFINTTLSGSQNFGTLNSGSVTLSARQGSSQTIYEDYTISTVWTTSGSNAVFSFTVGNYPIYQVTTTGGIVFTPSFQFQAGVQGAGFWNVGTVSTTMTLTPDGSGTSYSQTQSYTFNQEWTGTPNDWVEVSPSFLAPVQSGYYTMTFSLTVSPDSGYSFDSGNPAGLQTISDGSASNNYNMAQQTVANTYYGFYLYTYSGVSVSTSLTTPSNLQAWDLTWSAGQSGTTGHTQGIETSGFPTSLSWSQSGTPTVPSYSISYSTTNAVESETDIISNTTGITQSITENQNWWNGTFSAKFTPPSGWENGASLDGKTWNTYLSSYTVQHVLSAGYGTSPPVDIMQYSGYSSGSFNSPSQYESWSGSPAATENSAFALIWNIAEFINYKPQITVPPAATFSGSGSSMTFEIGTSEFNSSMKETVNVQWGDGATSSVFNHQPGLYTFTHSYTSTGAYTIQATVTNQPNGDPVSPSALSNSSSALYIITVTPNPSPSPNLPLNTGQAIWLNFSQSNVAISGVSLNVNGLGVSPVEHSSTSYSYLSSSAGISTVNAVWTLTGGSLTYTYSVAYASKVIPSNLSRSVSVLFSDNATHSYPITLSGVPSGNGTYQQLITITNPSQYGINSAGSNIQFAASNGTLLYAWEQSVNSSAIQVWIKNFNGSSQINMEVFPQFENLFSANGYLGEAPQLSPTYAEWDNAHLVFDIAQDYYANFTNAIPSGLSIDTGGNYSANNGLYMVTSSSSTDFAVITPNKNWLGYTDYGFFYNYSATSGTGHIGIGFTYPYAENNFATAGQSSITGSIFSQYQASSGSGSAYFEIYDLIGYLHLSYFLVVYTASMPTASISSTGQAFMANSSQINHPNYQSVAPTGSDLSSGYYQYNVPDYYNSAYATVFYNSSWEFYSASPQTWVLGASGGMHWIFFNDLTNSGTISFVLKEPIQIANPVGTMSVTYAPSSSVNGLALFNLPTSLLTLKANGVEVNPSGFQVVVGKPVSLQVLTTSGSLVYNKTFTPTALQDYEALAVNISSITFMNENMSQVVSVSVSSGNVTQDLAPIMPLETSTVYIPSGSYTWTFQALNLTTGAVVHSITASSTLNGLDWQIFTGLTFLDVKNTEIQQANNISSVLRTVNIDVLAGQNTTLIVNTTVNALNGSFKNLNLNETTFFTTLNSTMNNANVTITSDVAIVNSLVKTLNLKMLQSFAQIYGSVGQIYSVYSLLDALNNYIQSQGTGILQPKASEVAASFSTQVDPLEVIQGSSYANDTANLSANYTNLWISNPINETAFNSVLASTIHSQLTLNEIGPSSAYKLAVNYYTLKSGKLLLIHRDWYNNSAQLVQLNPSYIADGYVVDLNFSGYTQATGQQMYFQEYTTWSGSMNFDWTLNNNTKTYSDSFAVPGEQGFWNNILMSSVQSISHSQEFNMSSVMQNVIMGFPTSVTVNPASITLKDLTAGTTLTEGSNFYGSGTGIQFTTFNDTEHKYYATFQPILNVTVGNTIPLSLGAPTQTYLGQKEVYLATALYINTGGSQTANFILSITQSQDIENATVMVNGQIWPSNEVSIVGNQIVVDNVHMTPGESVSIKVYYSLAAPLTVYSALFFPLISGLTWLTPWFFVGVSLLVVLGVVVRNRKGKKETLYRGELGIIFLGFLVWFIVMMMHLQGAI